MEFAIILNLMWRKPHFFIAHDTAHAFPAHKNDLLQQNMMHKRAAFENTRTNKKSQLKQLTAATSTIQRLYLFINGVLETWS